MGGRLAVSVSPTSPGVEATIRFGRDDALWMESVDGEFLELALVGIESVLAVSGDAGLITVGGRDAEGRALVGVVQDGRVVATPLPGVSNLSAVTDQAGPAASPVALSRWRIGGEGRMTRSGRQSRIGRSWTNAPTWSEWR